MYLSVCKREALKNGKIAKKVKQCKYVKVSQINPFLSELNI